jgi:transposase
LKEDHRHGDSFRWYRSWQDDISPGGSWDNGKVLLKKKFTQRQLIAFTANLQTCLIGLEACSGAHFLGRTLRQQGHDAKLIPAQFVKPFVKSNKNDFIDAEAIAEAVDRENMRFVPIKTDDQLDLQALHRVRSLDRAKNLSHQPAARFPAGTRLGVREEPGQAARAHALDPRERRRRSHSSYVQPAGSALERVEGS